MTRVPAGHAEGYLEGFANIYTEVAHAIRAAREGKAPDAAVIYPTVEDGLIGVQLRRGRSQVEQAGRQVGEGLAQA